MLRVRHLKAAEMAKCNVIIIMVVLLMDAIAGGQWTFGGGGDGLSMNYYMMSCPFAEGIIKNIVNRRLQFDPSLAAPLVRMHFHDCFIQVLTKS